MNYDEEIIRHYDKQTDVTIEEEYGPADQCPQCKETSYQPVMLEGSNTGEWICNKCNYQDVI